MHPGSRAVDAEDSEVRWGEVPRCMRNGGLVRTVEAFEIGIWVGIVVFSVDWGYVCS